MHLKRYPSPKSWRIDRKKTTFITTPSPGPHPMKEALPLSVVLKTVGLANTTREAKKALNVSTILVDGRRVKSNLFPVGLMDTVSIPATNQHFLMRLDTKGKLQLVKVEKAGSKPCKIKGKTILKKGKVQINLFDNKNIIVEKDLYKVGDTILIKTPSQEIISHHPLDKKAEILQINGKNRGVIGVIEDIQGQKVYYKDKEGNVVETVKRNVFVLPPKFL